MIHALVKAAAAAVVAVALTPAASFAKTELKAATLAPEGTPWFDFLSKWEQAVEAASDGEIDIQIFPSAQLGNEWEVWNKVAKGRIEIGLFSAAVMSEKVPPMALMSTPFLFDSEQTAYCVYDTELKDEFTELLEERFKVISWGETGWVQVYAQDDLSDVANADGYKTRVAPQAMSRTLWASVGANGVEIPFADTPAALQTGLVRSGEATGISYVAFGLNKVAPHLMLTRHMHQAGSIMMGKKVWNKLTEDEQAILMDNMPDLNELRQGVMGVEQYLIGQYEEAGGLVQHLTPEQRAAWKAKVEPNWPAFVEDLGPEAVALWPRVLEAKKACGE